MPILAIDQGTTSSRAIVFDDRMDVIASAQREFSQHYPASGWVEHDPAELWDSVLETCRAALDEAGTVDAIGITNQRETVIIWDRQTGAPIHRAIVWQDRRTAKTCAALRAEGHEGMVTGRTGLLLDPYFTATKARWILDNVPGAHQRAEAGALALGTVDTFLIWHLTGGRVHATDATNAARTMLYNIRTGEWDADLCRLFGVPMALLPEVRDCNAAFGETDPAHFGRAIPILGVAGDQQAATIGQACFAPGMMKSTYGTGCFALMNTGRQMVASHNRLLTTVAYQLDGQTTYALEGSIFIAGAVVQWLRDGLGIIASAPDTQALADRADPQQQVIVVPAFTGLGAPYWRPECRGAVFGLTRNSGPPELARAALESVGFQTRDLWSAMQDDWAKGGAQAKTGVLRVDGGMSASDFAMQFLADILGAPVDRPRVLETTAMGAAWLAGAHAGLYPDATRFAESWALERRFDPVMPDADRSARYDAWRRAVAATIAAAG
ncbi:MAG: glycerol kinase GlpK [Rhodobacteraceae bacterium HLUCCA12]|nr:MAG: glycerol kinase GlpK [Rhodobacteraceae bacterium HLUCCA12]